jgi:hypothetical protein
MSDQQDGIVQPLTTDTIANPLDVPTDTCPPIKESARLLDGVENIGTRIIDDQANQPTLMV